MHFSKKSKMRSIHYLLYFRRFLPSDSRPKTVKNLCKSRHTPNRHYFSAEILSTHEKSEPMAQKVFKMGSPKRWQRVSVNRFWGSFFHKWPWKILPDLLGRLPDLPSLHFGAFSMLFSPCFSCPSGTKWHRVESRPKNATKKLARVPSMYSTDSPDLFAAEYTTGLNMQEKNARVPFCCFS